MIAKYVPQMQTKCKTKTLHRSSVVCQLKLKTHQKTWVLVPHAPFTSQALMKAFVHGAAPLGNRTARSQQFLHPADDVMLLSESQPIWAEHASVASVKPALSAIG